MHLHLHMYVYIYTIYIYPCIHIPICPSIHLSIYPYVHISIYPYIDISISPHIHISTYRYMMYQWTKVGRHTTSTGRQMRRDGTHPCKSGSDASIAQYFDGNTENHQLEKDILFKSIQINSICMGDLD